MSINREMNKEDVAIYNGYYSAIKKNKCGLFVEMWLDLEWIIQSTVRQKEKNKYHILIHVCGI